MSKFDAQVQSQIEMVFDQIECKIVTLSAKIFHNFIRAYLGMLIITFQ